MLERPWGILFAPSCLYALAMLGCSPSAVIPASDATFARANDRMEQTYDYVEASGAPPRERALFLQAESIYRYRYETRGSGAAVVGAYAGAAVTDFRILRSIGGSLDFGDARDRGADGAVQLWESFLLRYPCSTLRPLTLYRLGWAYHSVSATGFPRKSGEQAFDDLGHCACNADPTLVEAAHEARTSVEWKSKHGAAIRSFIPGWGQFYVGENLSGAIRLATAIVATAAIITPIVVGASRSQALTWSNDWPLLAIGAAGLIVLSFDYTSSFDDAQRGVVRWNERVERTFEEGHPRVP